MIETDNPPVLTQSSAAHWIRDSGKSNIIGGAIFTVIFSAICVWMVLAVFGARDDDKLWAKIALYVVFMALPILFVACLVFLIWHRRQFGGATLLLRKWPFYLGDEIVGELHLDKPLAPPTPVNIRLKCIRVINRRAGLYDRILFNYEYQIGPKSFRSSENSTVIPVRATISNRGQPTSPDWIAPIFWILEIEANSKKPHFDASFTITVKPAG